MIAILLRYVHYLRGRYRQFPQVRGFSARFYGVTAVEGAAVRAVEALAPAENVLQALRERFVKLPPLHRLGQTATFGAFAFAVQWRCAALALRWRFGHARKEQGAACGVGFAF